MALSVGFLRGNAAAVDHAADRDAVLLHPLEDDAGVEGGPFDRREQVVLRRVGEVPAERDPAQFRVDEHGPVAVVPGEVQQAGLAGAVRRQALRERGDGRAGAPRDRVEDVAGGREARLDPGQRRVHRAGNDAAQARHARGLVADGDDAGRGADHVDHVAEADAGADRVPVRVEGADRDRDAGAQPHPFGPRRRQAAGQRVGGRVAARDLVPHAGKQRVHRREEALWRQAAERRAPHPLVAHRADAARHLRGIGDPAERGRHHVAVLERGDDAVALVGVVAQPVQQLRESPLRRVGVAAPVDRLEAGLVRLARDLGGFAPAAVVAPEVVVVERHEALADRHDARPGGVDGQRRDGVAVHPGRLDRAPRGERQRVSSGRRGSASRGPGRSSSGGAGTRPRPIPAAPSRESTMDTRTLRVPKSTPATIMERAPPGQAFGLRLSAFGLVALSRALSRISGPGPTAESPTPAAAYRCRYTSQPR